MVPANLSYNYQRTKVTGIRNMRNSTANQLLLDKQKLQLLDINLNKNVRKWGKEKHLNLFFYPFLKLHLVTNLKDRDVLKCDVSHFTDTILCILFWFWIHISLVSCWDNFYSVGTWKGKTIGIHHKNNFCVGITLWGPGRYNNIPLKLGFKRYLNKIYISYIKS